MAKVVSSKPYATGQGKKPTTPKMNSKNDSNSPKKTSPVRTSPRKRASEEATSKEVKVAKSTQGKKAKSRPVPQAPTFNDNKRTASPRKSPRKAVRSEEEVEPEDRESEKEAVDEKAQLGEVVEEPSELRRSPRRASIEAQQRLVISKLEFSTSEESENSPVFVQESVQQDEETLQQNEEDLQEDEDNNPFLNRESEEFVEEEEYDTEEDEDEEEDDLIEEYNSQFQRHSSTASVIKERIRSYFTRREQNDSASAPENAVWKRVTSWIGESLLPTALELTQNLTQKAVELTKTALVQLGPQPRPEVIDVDDEYEQFDEAEMSYENDDDVQEQTAIQEQETYVEEEEEVISPKRMKIDSEPLHFDVPEATHLPPATFDFVPKVDVVVEARLTEIVLFLARCSSTTPTPTIYEHLEEFFRLKGAAALNPTELSLVHNVIKEHLLVGSISLTPVIPPSQVSREVSEEGRKMADIMATAAVMNDSPSKSVRLPASGVRFRAPTFSPEEEARIDAILESRKQQQKQKDSTALSTTGVRSRLQRKLLDLDRTIEIFESIPTVVDNRDSIQAAINSIINEKIKNAKQKEEEDRAETEKLKARISELERERKERELKDALLAQQSKAQAEKKEEKKATFDFGAPVKVAESSKTSEPTPSFSAKPSTSFLPSQLPSATTSLNPAAPSFKPVQEKPAFDFGKSAEKPTLTGFAFGSSAASIPAETKPALSFGSEVKSTDSKPSFSFGSETKSADSKSSFSFGTEVKAADSKPSFSFGDSKPSESAEPKPAFSFVESKPALSFGDSKSSESKPSFSFGEAKPLDSKSSFSFGASKTEEPSAMSDSKPSFSFGEAKPTTSFGTSQPSAFSFGDSKLATDSKPSFSFGNSSSDAKPASSFGNPSSDAKPAFSFGNSSSESKPAFSFGSEAKASAPSFNFGTTDSKPAFGSSFGFGASAQPQPQTSAAPASNPFASLGNSGFGAAPASNPFSNVFASNLAASQGTSSSSLFPPAPSLSPSPAQSSTPVFNFGQAAPTSSFVPMNFGSSTPNEAGSGFDTGNRSISVPKRRLRR